MAFWRDFPVKLDIACVFLQQRIDLRFCLFGKSGASAAAVSAGSNSFCGSACRTITGTVLAKIRPRLSRIAPLSAAGDAAAPKRRVSSVKTARLVACAAMAIKHPRAGTARNFRRPLAIWRDFAGSGRAGQTRDHQNCHRSICFIWCVSPDG